jgi:transposase-like protein
MEQNSVLEQALELLVDNNPQTFSKVLQFLMNQAMVLEREQVLNAKAYERSPDRTGYANGFKSPTLNTRVGSLELNVPQTRNVDFYPSILEKGLRSERALWIAMAEMYVQGVSTRKVSRLVEEMCGFSVSSTQVSKATKVLDQQLDPWMSRELKDEPIVYLYLDATYEKVRRDGVVQDAAVFVAMGVTATGMRRVLGLSVEISEAEAHWRSFLESLLARGLHGLLLVISDAHSGLKAALKAVLPSLKWQRCQFHLQQNAGAYVARKDQRQKLASEVRDIFQSRYLEEAQQRLNDLVASYQKSNKRLAEWLEVNIPEGLTCFQFPEQHRKKIRTTNMVERNNREVKRRTKVATLFCSEESIQRSVGTLLMEQDDEWLNGRRYINMEVDRVE